jgi:hypothetical protein
MSKKNLLLGGILVVLVVLAFIKEGPLKDWQEKSSKPKNILAEIMVDQVSRIDINYRGTETTIEKMGDKWLVAGTKDFYLKDELVNTVQTALNESVKAEVEVVSTNKDKKDEFSTTDETGARVKLMQGETVIKELLIGKTGPDFTSTYVSLDDIDETYAVKANLNNAFWRSDWYNREIFNNDSEKIDKIRFQYPTREFTVEKGEDGWSGTLPYIFSVDEDKLRGAINVMSNLQAREIPPQSFEGTGLEKNLIIVQATGEDVDNVLMVGEAKANDVEDEEEGAEENTLYYVKRGDSDNIYLITKDQRDELDKQIGDLR